MDITLFSFASAVISIAEFVTIVSVVLGVIFIIWAGVVYMAAGDDIEKAGAAKARAVKSIFILLIIFGIGLIIQTLASASTGFLFLHI